MVGLLGQKKPSHWRHTLSIQHDVKPWEACLTPYLPLDDQVTSVSTNAIFHLQLLGLASPSTASDCSDAHTCHLQAGLQKFTCLKQSARIAERLQLIQSAVAHIFCNLGCHENTNSMALSLSPFPMPVLSFLWRSRPINYSRPVTLEIKFQTRKCQES